MNPTVPTKSVSRNTKSLLRLTAAFVALSFLATPQVLPSSPAGGAAYAATAQSTVDRGLRAASKGQWTQAESAIAQARNPVASKLYQWIYYTEGGPNVSFARVSDFIRKNPDWPQQRRMTLAAEKAMPSDLSAAEVSRWFRDYPPQTAEGMNRFIGVLRNTGSDAEARQVLREWWPTVNLAPAQQADVIARHAALFDRDAHIARYGVLMDRKSYANARALARVLGRGYPELTEARIVLASGQAGVDGVVARVPAALEDDPGLMYERLRWRRKNDQDFGAIELLHKMPPADKLANPAEWWAERNIIARRLIERKQYESAYLLVKKHGMKEGPSFAEGEFLAGWLALRFLNKPFEAFEHFERLYNNAATPISKARGAYWAARASEKLGHTDIAREWDRVAATHQTTFYGQMSVSKLPADYRPPQQTPPEKTLPGKERFDRKDMVQAARMLHSAGLWDDTTVFLDALADSAATPEDFRYVAELAESLKHYHNAIRLAKAGLNKGILLMDQLYPTMLSPMRGVNQEWALVHALIRQESAFNLRAVSPVGARGLMQLMPATAKERARKSGVPYSPDRLVSDPAYNIKLGSHYFQELLDRYDGNYAMALAGYNAGPSRVAQWVEKYGDPRKGEIDIVDWIEHIPFTETRNYVQRVLENVYIYRIKLQDVQRSVRNAPIHVAMNDGPG